MRLLRAWGVFVVLRQVKYSERPLLAVDTRRQAQPKHGLTDGAFHRLLDPGIEKIILERAAREDAYEKTKRLVEQRGYYPGKMFFRDI